MDSSTDEARASRQAEAVEAAEIIGPLGIAEIGRAVAFRYNVVSSGSIIDGAVGGGAIALTQAASLNAQEAPMFEANEATGTEPKGGALFVEASSAVVGSGLFEANNVTVLAKHGYGGASPSHPVTPSAAR